MRLRQAVLVSSSLQPLVQQLRSEFALGEPFADPGVGEFGVHNAVFAIGDTFLEVISPVKPDAAAARYIERHGEGGYMLIFQVDDLAAARERARSLGIREVWTASFPDIAAAHLHPADIGGAIVSVDRPVPPSSWRWGGPAWEKRASAGRLAGATVRAEDPVSLAERWSSVLGAPLDNLALPFDGGAIRFEKGDTGLAEIALSVPPDIARGRTVVDLGGVRFRLEAA